MKATDAAEGRAAYRRAHEAITRGSAPRGHQVGRGSEEYRREEDAEKGSISARGNEQRSKDGQNEVRKAKRTEKYEVQSGDWATGRTLATGGPTGSVVVPRGVHRPTRHKATTMSQPRQTTVSHNRLQESKR